MSNVHNLNPKLAKRELTVTTTAAVVDILEELVETGYYGTSVEHLAEQLIRQQLQQIAEGAKR